VMQGRIWFLLVDSDLRPIVEEALLFVRLADPAIGMPCHAIPCRALVVKTQQIRTPTSRQPNSVREKSVVGHS